MAPESTRKKIKRQGLETKIALERTMTTLINILALANEHSDYINSYLPPIVASLDAIIKVWDEFYEGL